MWYINKIEDIYQKLNSNEDGLTNEIVQSNLEKYGKNELPKKKKDSIFKIFYRQILDPIIFLLILTAVFSFFINEIIDAGAIVFIILIDLFLGTFQEWKAEKDADSLLQLIKVKIKVLRDGTEQEINSTDLVVGDVALLEPGNKINADLRIIECYNLTIDESVLTGESIAVNKINNDIIKKTVLSERENMIYAGTSVLTGRAKCIVVEVGLNTELGKIVDTVSKTAKAPSPLTIRMEKFSKQISILVLIIAVILTIIYISKGVPTLDIFSLVIALTVSAMPEGLPLALTLVLTIASNRMAKKNVIVKQLNHVESLGSCTVIASDKTGTLTVNEQTAKKIVLPDDTYFNIEGSGYNNYGRVINNYNNITSAYEIAFLGSINNEADLNFVNNKWQYYGDSIDIAFLALGKKMNVNISNTNIYDQIPYESENKYSAVFYEKDNQVFCTVKGSIEKVLEFATTMGKNLITIDKEKLITQNEQLAKDGYRVIAMANGVVEKKTDFEYKEEDIKELNFCGLVSFIDPIRDGTKEAIKECKQAGIKVLMITGDHPLTAFAISKELDLIDDYKKVTTGQELEKYLHVKEKFDNFIKDKTVFARVTPLEKLAIIESYKRQKEFIAVTGDGVNDAAAIKSANIGISMGSGSDVAKEASSMIITDDNFNSIVVGIKAGRTAYSNIRKVILMLLSCGIAEVLFFILSIIFNLPLPLIAIQLLWLNIITDGLQDMALAFEQSEDNIMREKPKDTRSSIFDKDLRNNLLVSGLTIGGVVFLVWVYLIKYINMDVALARGYIVMLMVFMQNMHVLNCRSEKQSIFKLSFKANPLVILTIISAIILQIVVMETSVLSQFLQTSPIPVKDIFILFIISTVILFVLEIYKKINRKFS